MSTHLPNDAARRLATRLVNNLLDVRLLAVVALVQACATTPTGRKQFIIVPDAQMDAMGQEAFQQIQQEEPVETDPAITGYVECVAEALLAQVESDDTDWEVVVFSSDMVNAFALPGGRIGVFNGMLRVAHTQDQLAAVIGHEIAHVVARHGAERVSQHLALGTGLDVVQTVMGDARSRNIVLAALGVGAQVGVLLPFSRQHESEADVIGQELMAQAGFDPQGSVTLWERMQAASPEGPPEFLSTHPSHARRIAELRENLETSQTLFREARAEGLRPACTPPGAPGDSGAVPSS